jgi:hypothetical protein
MTKESPLRVLFIANNPTFRHEMEHLANYMSDDFSTLVVGASRDIPKKKPLWRRSITIVGESLGNYGLIPLWWKQHRFKQQIDSLMINALHLLKGFDFVFVSGDRSPETIEGAILSCCRRLNIPSAIAPVGVLGEAKDLIYFRRGKKEHVASKELAKLFPQIVRFDDETRTFISFYPVMQLPILSINGLLSSNPWVMGAGQASYVCVMSEFWAKRLERDGVKKEKIVVTGHLQHDRLARTAEERSELRKKMSVDYGLDDNKQWLIFAPPPLFEHQIYSEEKHWEELDFVVANLKNFLHRYEVIISLHPKMSPSRYAKWSQTHGLSIIPLPLGEWINTGDAFVSSFSTTVDWAVGLGMPVVVFDFYGFNFDFFDAVPGVEVVSRKDEFHGALGRLLILRESVTHKKTFDGNAGIRLKDLVRRSGKAMVVKNV